VRRLRAADRWRRQAGAPPPRWQICPFGRSA